MPACVLPTGCIASPNCTNKCQLSVLDAENPVSVDRAKLKAALGISDSAKKE